jgi:hypothetical protein
MLAISRISFLILISYAALAQDVKLMKSTMSASASGLSKLVTVTLSVNHTIGQSSLVTHLRGNQIHLLQGFQHPYLNDCIDCDRGNNSISVYPNPSQGLVTIRWDEDESNEIVWLDVVDVHGKLVLKIMVERKGNEVQFNASSLPKAAYVLQVRGAKSGYATQTLILI